MGNELSIDKPFLVHPEDFDLGVGTVFEEGELPVGSKNLSIRIDDLPGDPMVFTLHPNALLKVMDFVIRHKSELME